MIQLICETCGAVFLRQQRTSHGGKPKRFCSPACRYKTMRGEKHQNYRNGRYVPESDREYVTVLKEGHPRAHHGRVKEHILVAEAKLGGPLPVGAEVHHENGDKKDNRPENLTVCHSRKEHMVREAKLRRLKDLGSLDVRRCTDCEAVSPLGDFHRNKNNWDGRHHVCKECMRVRTRAYANRARSLRRSCT